MKKSSAPAPANKIGAQPEPKPLPELEFPVSRDFISRPPRLDPQVMLERCAQTMPWRSSRPEEKARRQAERIPIEFVL